MQRLALIQDCAARAFAFRLGDPSTMGLALTALYVLASVLFLTLAFRREGWAPGDRLLWTSAAIVVVALTLNKQLDLQQWVVWTGRCVARAEGWFDQRLAFQRAFGMTMLAIMALGVGWLLWSCRQALGRNRALLAALFLMGLFVVLQIFRFEQMAGSLGQTIARLRLHRALEALALVALIWAALRRILAR